jgi:mannose-6-phosphate isomerase-like protein (cupin superfamily)
VRVRCGVARDAEQDARETSAMTDEVFDLSRFPAHIGLGARVERLSEFDGSPDWYMSYGAAHSADGLEGRLVSMHTFTEPWTSWERHPNGDELVLCVDGQMTLHQEVDGSDRTVTLRAGEAVINPPGVWHTADVEGPATAVFITAGAGTEVRARD